MDEKKTGKEQNRNKFGFGILIGVGIGVALGVALDNIAIGIAIGVAVGVAFGAGLDSQARKNEDDKDEE